MRVAFLLPANVQPSEPSPVDGFFLCLERISRRSKVCSFQYPYGQPVPGIQPRITGRPPLIGDALANGAIRLSKGQKDFSRGMVTLQVPRDPPLRWLRPQASARGLILLAPHQLKTVEVFSV